MTAIIFWVQSTWLGRILQTTFTFCDRFLAPLMDLLIRLWMARIFWKSGINKISTWAMTLAAFRLDYKVPLLSPELAAYITTIIEIMCPILLVLGLATRLAAIPMLIVVAVIQFTYLNFYEHAYWAILLGIIVVRGPDMLSIDYLISRVR